MKADVFWVNEDLLARELPKTTEPFSHGYVVLPLRRNSLDDGFAFVMRLSLRKDRRRDPTTGRARIYPFERWLDWGPIGADPQSSILMAHSLLPVAVDVLTVWRGQAVLEGGILEDCQQLVAGLLWDSETAHRLLKRASTDGFVPDFVRGLQPGMVVTVDGAPGVVVSNSVLHRRHHFGSLALVPLMARPPHERSGRVRVGSLVAVPEFLKICQPLVDPLLQVRPDDRRLSPEELEVLTGQVRDLLSWEEPARPLPTSTPARPPEHPCLFSNNARPWRAERARGVNPGPGTFSGAEAPFEPSLLDAESYEGPHGGLRIELWIYRGEVYVDVVRVDGAIPMIDMLSVLSDDRTINVVRGPLSPGEWVLSQTIGPLSEVQERAIEVSVCAVGLAANYTFVLEHAGA